MFKPLTLALAAAIALAIAPPARAEMTTQLAAAHSAHATVKALESARLDAVRARDALAKNQIDAAREALKRVDTWLAKTTPPGTHPSIQREVGRLRRAQASTLNSLLTPAVALRESKKLVDAFTPALRTTTAIYPR